MFRLCQAMINSVNYSAVTHARCKWVSPNPSRHISPRDGADGHCGIAGERGDSLPQIGFSGLDPPA